MAQREPRPPDERLGEILAPFSGPPPRGSFWRSLLASPSRWLGRLGFLGAVVVTGVLLGQQYWQPNKRVIPVLLAVLVAGITWRLDILPAIGLLVCALPYPRGTVFGNTNLALILMLVVLWLAMVAMRRSPRPSGSPINVPLAGLMVVYVLSFYNVRNGFYFERAIQNFELFIGCVFMHYLMINNIRTVKDLERLHVYQLVCALSVFLLAIYELNHPGLPFISGWLDFTTTIGTEFNTRNVRVGASFHDYELLSEFCALTLLLASFMLIRARSATRRGLLILFIILNVFVTFATVTRGAILALAVGVPYLLWHVRRHIRFVPLTIVGVAAVGLLLGTNFYVAHFTRSGDMFARLGETHLVQGWAPADRIDTWRNAWERALTHPMIGQGPFYWEVPGYRFWWPHNVYLYYANIVGFVGLAFFLWIVWTFFRITRPVVDDLRDADYAKAFLLIAHTQVIVFIVNEMKIDYLRNPIYQMTVWVWFSMWTATYLIARRPPEPQIVTARAG
jgi:hypothetical protein